MKKFVAYLGKVCIYSLGIAFILQIIADSGLRNTKNSVFNDWNELLEGNLNSELIIMGSSRGIVGYDPQIFEELTNLNAYNLSVNGGSHNLQYKKMEAYFKHNRAPQALIQNIDISHLSKTHFLPEEYQYLPFLSNNSLKTLFHEGNHQAVKYDFIPLLKYNNHHEFFLKGILSHVDGNLVVYPTKNGYTPKNKAYKLDDHNIERLLSLRDTSTVLARYSEGLAATKNYLQNIPSSTKIFLVWAPEHEIRQVIVAPAADILKKEINNICIEMPNVYFLDFSSDPMSLDPDNFYDSFHLNQEGARKFSIKAGNRIKDILEE